MVKAYVKALWDLDFPLDFPGHFIAGTFAQCEKGSLVKDIINPSSGKPLATIRLDKALIDAALTAAEECEPRLKSMTVGARFEILRQFREALLDFQDQAVLAMQVEAGKPRWEAIQEFDAAVRFLDHMIAQEEHLFEDIMAPLRTPQQGVRITLCPVGTVLGNIPFTTPCTSFVKFFAVSLIAGDPLVVMASAHASLLSTLMACVFEECDFPKGILSVLCGNFELFREGCQDRRVKAVIYRGSHEHSMTIRRENFSFLDRPAVIQSGGKNAALIHSSADLEHATRLVLFGALKSAGQLCTSTSRVFVPTTKLSEMVEILRAKLGDLKIGPTDSLSSNPMMGPLYSRKSVEKFLRFQTMAKREAKQTIQWGKTIDLGCGGFFVTPGVHLMSELDNHSAYQSNVLLFPDLAIYAYDDMQGALRHLNDMSTPLVVSIITDDPSDADIAKMAFDAPNVAINLPTVEMEAQLPVAGRGPCGSVRHNGIGLVENLTYPVARFYAENMCEVGHMAPTKTES